MKKQILYPRFISRIMSMTLDLVILSVCLSPLMNLIAQYVFIHTFQDYFILHNINTSDNDAMSVAIRSNEFKDFITLGRFLQHSLILLCINTLFVSTYFIIFWRKFCATPGKMIMRMKVVNADDYQKATVGQLIKRFIGYFTALIGMWSILYTKRGTALHDKMSGTVVIKS